MSGDEAPTWREVPIPRSADPGLGGGVLELLAWFVAVFGPLYRTWPLGRVPALVVFAVGTAATIVMSRIPDRLWWLRAPAALLGLAVIGPAKKVTALYLVIGLVLADWGVRRRRLVPVGPTPTDAALPGLVLLAAFFGIRAQGAIEPRTVLQPLAYSAAIIVVTSLIGERFAGFVRRFGRRVGDVVSTIGFGILSVPVIVLPWLANRLVGLDPLASGAAPGTNWLGRTGADVRSKEPWQPEATTRAGRGVDRLRAAVSAILVAAACAAVLVPVTRAFRDDVVRSPPPTDAPSAGTAAMAHYPWYPDYLEDINWLWQTAVAWDPLAPVRLRDVTTRYITIEDGARKTWRPPACRCRRIHVWMYGGSTTFGLGQRDLHTTASEIARAAWAHGIALDIDNRGVVGDTHWEEANRLAWDMATLRHPDLVVFLDGINDEQALDRLQYQTRQPISFVKDDFWQNFLATGGTAEMDGRWAPSRNSDGGNKPPGASLPPKVPVKRQGIDETAKLVADRYDTAHTISANIGQANHVPIEYFWQPSLEYRPQIPGEYPMPGHDFSRRVTDKILTEIAPGVHSIVHSLDRVKTPLYWDYYHTNELGAHVVGETMYRVLARELARMARS